MDLTINVNEYKLNIRVAVLIKTQKGYVFEKSKTGFFYVVGGRVKISESSLEAAKREVFEEIGKTLSNMELVAVLENFFSDTHNISTHEFCFVYQVTELLTGVLPEGFYEIPENELAQHDIRPSMIKDIISNAPQGLVHIINK